MTVHGHATVVQDPNLPQGEKLYLARDKIRTAFSLTGATQQSLITDHRDWSAVTDQCVTPSRSLSAKTRQQLMWLGCYRAYFVLFSAYTPSLPLSSFVLLLPHSSSVISLAKHTLTQAKYLLHIYFQNRSPPSPLSSPLPITPRYQLNDVVDMADKGDEGRELSGRVDGAFLSVQSLSEFIARQPKLATDGSYSTPLQCEIVDLYARAPAVS